MADCIGCGRELTQNEIALHKKIKDVRDTEFFCIHCLAGYYKCEVSALEEKMKHYIFLGCPLFEENQ
ncbi:MAG: hypothetical protein IJ407_01935 [Clostridia bacterium]|nr:hypothetical protein [Clostridia bacterium]